MAEYDAYLHIEFTNDPDNYVKNDGSTFEITLTFREGESEDSDILTAITGVNFIVPFCDLYGTIYDTYEVTLTDGQVTFNFITSSFRNPEVIYINNRAIEPIYIGSDVYRAKNKVVDFKTKKFTIYSTEV